MAQDHFQTPPDSPKGYRIQKLPQKPGWSHVGIANNLLNSRSCFDTKQADPNFTCAGGDAVLCCLDPLALQALNEWPSNQ